MNKFFAGREPICSRTFWIACIAVCVIGLLLRMPTLGRSLWIDETYSALFSSMSLHELWTSVPLYETHPPMYYSMLKGWNALFGNTEIAMRSLSVLASVVTILFVAVSGKLLGAGALGDRVALLAALFLAVNKGSIEYAQQARPYALETLTASIAILSSLVLLRILKAQSGRTLDLRALLPGILGLAIASGMTLWLHNTGLFIGLGIWAGLSIALLAGVPGNRFVQAAVIGVPGVLAILIWSPFLPLYLLQSSNTYGMAFWITTKWTDFLSAWSLVAGGNLPVVPLCLLIVLGFIPLWRKERYTALHVATILLLPLLSILVISYLVKPIFINRLFVWMAPLAMAVAALGVLEGVRQAGLRRWAALLIVVLGLAATGRYYVTPTEDWRGLLGQIGLKAQPGDVIITVPNTMTPPISYYASASKHFPDVVYIPSAFPVVGLPRTYVGNLAAPAIIPADRELVRAAMATHKRVWMITRNVHLYDPEGLMRAEVLTARKLVGEYGSGPITIELFE